MPLTRILAFGLFVAAGLAGAHRLVHASSQTILALIAFGLAAYMLSTFVVPKPPPSR